MIDTDEFKNWLKLKKEYTPKVCNDIVCRLHRCDKIKLLKNNQYYLYELMECEEFKLLSVSVRSQCKKAVILYFEFLEN